MAMGRYASEFQLEFRFEFASKECRSRYHDGDRRLPLDEFVKNGAHTRNTCRACWAKEQRSNRADGYIPPTADNGLVMLLNRLWIVNCDQKPPRRKWRNRNDGQCPSETR